jgi:NO-binding membrane sensor protein with MHYT domain
VYGVAHEPWIVALSILVAIQGSYVALGLTLKVSSTEGLPRRVNLAAAAVTFAVSIWSMHFIGILALRLPFQLDYLVLPTLLSFLMCVFVVGVAVLVASYAPVWRFAVPLAGLTMGLGIATMHYIGMLALHHSALMYHNPVYVVASFAVAIIASALGLGFAFTPRRGFPVALAAVLFGLAISGMHYIAMAGLTLSPFAGHADLQGSPDAAISPDLLAVIVTIVAFAVSALFLLTLVPDRGPRTAAAEPATEPGPPDPPMPARLLLAVGPLGGAGSAQPRRPARALAVERGGATHYVPVETIVMVQADAHYTLVFDGQTRSFCSLPIGEVESRLDPACFLRVHRSYIVAIEHIVSLRRCGDGGTAEFGIPERVSVPVSRARYATLKARVEARV